MLRYCLPNQLYEWRIDKRVSFARGILFGLCIGVALMTYVDLKWLLPFKLSQIQAEKDALEVRCRDLSSENSRMAGVLTQYMGKNAGKVVDNFRKGR